MAQYRTTIESTWSPQEAFGYLSDLGNTRQWDPSVARAHKLGDDPVGGGSAFLVVTRFRGREVELEYRVTVYQPGERVVTTAETPRLRSVDELTFLDAARNANRLVAVMIAATMGVQDRIVRASIRALRASGITVPVLVGGGAIDDEAHARCLGADGWSGRDARSAAEHAASLAAARRR